MIRTASDMQNTLMRWLGAQDNPQSVMDCREAINDALKEIWGKHDWPWYQGQQTLKTDAPESTGTVTFDLATRRFTLTGATWPSWAEYGVIVVGTKFARVDRLVSSTIIEVEDYTQFTADISSATAYKLWRAEYPIPNNIRKVSYFTNDSNTNHVVQYIPPLEFSLRKPGLYGTIPLCYTVVKDRRVMNGLNVVFWPSPSQAWTFRFPYVRAPLEVEVWSASEGRIATTAGTKAIVGTDTAFLDAHVGSVLRVGRDATNIPTAKVGLYPRLEEVLIHSVTDGTNLDSRSNLVYTSSNRKYEISSIIDIDETIMASAFIQQCFLQLGNRRNKDGKEMSTINAALMIQVRSAINKSSVPTQISYAGQGRQTAINQWFQVGVV